MLASLDVGPRLHEECHLAGEPRVAPAVTLLTELVRQSLLLDCDLRIAGQVVELPGILVQVVKLLLHGPHERRRVERPALPVHVGIPHDGGIPIITDAATRAAGRIELAVPFQAGDDPIAILLDPAGLPRRENRQQAAAGHAGGHGDAGRAEERRREVGEAHEVGHGPSSRYPGRPHHRQRHMAPEVVGRGLAAQLPVVIDDERAVVGRHHHERVLCEAMLFEAREHPRQVAVGQADLVEKTRPFAAVFRCVRDEGRQRHLVERHAELLLQPEVVVRAPWLVGLIHARPEEERLASIPRLEKPREVARVIAGRHASGRVGDHRASDVSPQRRPGNPERRVRPGPPAFAGARRLVAVVGENLRNGRNLAGDEGLDERPLLEFPELPAGEHARPRGRARRRRGEPVGEQHAVLRHPVERRCGQLRLAVGAQLDCALVIGDEKQDVRRRLFGRHAGPSRHADHEGGRPRGGPGRMSHAHFAFSHSFWSGPNSIVG